MSGDIAHMSSSGRSATGNTPVTRVLVVGNSRSGTTMLARMLGRHSEVVAMQELHFVEEHWVPGGAPLAAGEAVAVAERLLHNQREWYHTPFSPGALTDVARDVVDGLVPDAAGHYAATAVFAAVLDHEARAAGRRIAVEQTPRNVFFVETLLSEMPGTMAVVLARDPLDVMLSQKNWWRRRFRGTTGVPWHTTLRQWADYHPVTTSLVWRGGARAGLKVREDPRVVSVRFEDLLADPTTERSRILALAGLTLEPAMLDAPRISSSNSGDRGGVGVDTSVVGRWRDGLSRAEVWTNQRIAGTEAHALGYPAQDVGLPLPGLLGHALTWVPRTALAVLLNRARTRSIVASARRRLRP